jgi:8-oxo-dGTP pyrophosphatase MutT (NUDIX family)
MGQAAAPLCWASVPHSAVKPRDAASLVIVRGRGSAARVLLGRREPRHRFMPDVWVFPGGQVDRSDARAPASSELSSAVAAKLEERWPPVRARALAVAAIRETFEETGFAFGELVNGKLLPDLSRIDYLARAITPALSPIRFHARFFLGDAADGSGRLGGNGELLDLRWIPISEALGLPIIIVTRFVLEETARRLAGQPPTGVLSIRFRRERPLLRYE